MDEWPEEVVETIDDVVRIWDGHRWLPAAMEGFLDDLPEHYRSEAPDWLRVAPFRAQVNWLVGRCEPPYTPREIHDWLVEYQTP